MVRSFLFFFLFFSYQFAQANSELFTHSRFPGCSPDHQIACKGLFSPRDGQENQLFLLEGEQAFSYRLESLRRAKKTIRLQYLIWKADEAGVYLAELLKEKARQGVRVEIIVDGWANYYPKRNALYEEMRKAGIEIRGDRGLLSNTLSLAGEIFDGFKGTSLFRFHEKLWVIDAGEKDAIAITGGLNIANEYFRISREAAHKWTDLDIGVRGSAVDDFAQIFDRNLLFFRQFEKNIHFSTADPYNDHRPITLPLKKEAGLFRQTQLDWDQTSLDSHFGLQKIVNQLSSTKTQPKLYKVEKLRVFQQRPRLNELYIQNAYLDLIDNAEKEILIVNSYFIPTEDILNSLINAVKRGVKIHIITNSHEASDLRIVVTLGRYYYWKLLSINSDPLVWSRDGSLRLYEWRGPSSDEGTLHSKWMVVDRQKGIIGSYNLDPRSKYLNSETALVFKGRELAFELTKRVYHQHLKANEKNNSPYFYQFVNEIDPQTAYGYYDLSVLETIKKGVYKLVENQM